MKSIQEIVERASVCGSVFEAAMTLEVELSGESRDIIWDKMVNQWKVMKRTIDSGNKGIMSHTRLTGGDAKKLDDYIKSGNTICNPLMLEAVRNAIATNEVNASMGLICATPTAGSAGVVPGVLFSLAEHYNLTEEKQIEFLFVAALFGYVIANNASISGAMGGCQAEIGSASAMASAATVYVLGGTASMSAHALAITIKNMLGLICDPVAGLVEIPCIKRNALGATQALVSADMALAGIESRITPDDVIAAMHKVGTALSADFRETGKGGLADTVSGKTMERQIFGK